MEILFVFMIISFTLPIILAFITNNFLYLILILVIQPTLTCSYVGCVFYKEAIEREKQNKIIKENNDKLLEYVKEKYIVSLIYEFIEN